MNTVAGYFDELQRRAIGGWNRFWFTPTDPATLGLIRILAGSMIFYTHAVWSLDLQGFFGSQGRLSAEFVHTFHGSPWAWTHFDWGWAQSPTVMWSVHVLALLIMAMLTVGLYTRVTSVLTFLITVSYVHRVPGALFGLDQVNAMLALYLMIGPSGMAYSLDRRIALRRGAGSVSESISANIAIRLIQLHMCIIYLFAGFGKLLGDSWWDGTAMWLAFANFEYQSMDMTWLGQWPMVINLMTHIVVVWEVTYCALVWPRLTRPLVLALAIPLHLGIAMCMGMITFGLAMLFANLAFVAPSLVRSFLQWIAAWTGQGRGGAKKARAG